MNEINKLKLVCKDVNYHSHCDEEFFFEWLDKIKAIARIEGVGDELYVFFKKSKISDDDLRELISLFYRYKVDDMKQLKIFLNEKNKKWFFESPKGYWHRRVFGVPNSKK